MKHKIIRCLALVLSVILAGCSMVRRPPPVVSQAAPEAGTSISTMHMLDARHGWALTGGLAGQQRLLLTSNGGKSWRDATPRGADGVGAVDDANEGVYFRDVRHGWVSVWGQGKPGLWRTSNGGKSWSYAGTHDLLRDFHFRDASHGVACSSDYGAGNAYYRFYETPDGGTNWQPVNITPPGGDEPGLPAGTLHLCNLCTDLVDYRPPGKVIITHGDFGDEQPRDAVRLTLSTNLGKSWRDLNLPLPSEKYRAWLVTSAAPVFFDGRSGDLAAHLVQESADGNTMAANAMIFYTTHDGGETWTPGPGVIETGGDNLGGNQPLEIVSSQDIFVCAGPNLQVTHDGAKSWHTIKSNLNFGRSTLERVVLQLDFVDATHGWALISDNSGESPEGVDYLYKTTDGGVAWVELPLIIE